MTILLQNAQQGGGLSGMLMIVAMIVIFYFFMIRPQSKKQKEIKKAREALGKGDKVVTAGGIYGRITAVNINEGTFMVEIAHGVTIKVGRDSIYPAAAEQTPSKKNDKKEDKKPVKVEKAETEEVGETKE